MATRAETFAEISAKIKDGNISDAYRTYEDLPIVDQLAISISPGVGDVLATYEVKEFGSRGKKNIQDKDYLGAAGNYGMSALSGVSLIPLLRFLRVAKPATKVVSKVSPPKPKATPKPTIPKDPIKLPSVEEFVPLELSELTYRGAEGLGSKAAKYINYNKKLPNQAPVQTYLAKLKQSVPLGELRLLNIIDESGDLSPKLLKELDVRGSDKISRKRLLNYITSNQEGALGKKYVRKGDHESPGRIKNQGSEYTNEMQSTYQVRDVTRKGNFSHYRGEKDAYVFDATADYRVDPLGIPEDVLPSSFFDGLPTRPSFLNVARIQSDYSSELSNASGTGRNARRKFINDGLAEHSVKIGPYNIDTLARSLKEHLGKSPAKIKSIMKTELAETGNPSRANDALIPLVDEFVDVYLDVAKKAPKNTPYLPAGAGDNLKKALTKYNESVPVINALRIKSRAIQKEITEVLDAERLELLKFPDVNQDKVKKLRDKINKLNEKKIATELELRGTFRKANENSNIESAGSLFTDFSLKTKDLEKLTGKPFYESLDKSLDEIYLDLEKLPGGGIRQTYAYAGDDPLKRAAEYFKKTTGNTDLNTFELTKGVILMKKALGINTKNLDGYNLDAYAKGNRSEVTKLPIRANFLRAVKEGKDGLYLDSAAKRLGDEGGLDNDILKTTYKEAESEIGKIINELNLPKKDYIASVDPRGAESLSGTYVKFDARLKAAVEKLGIDAFKDGGSVDIDNMLSSL